MHENKKDEFWSKASTNENSMTSNENNYESKDQLTIETQGEVNIWSDENKETNVMTKWKFGLDSVIDKRES